MNAALLVPLSLGVWLATRDLGSVVFNPFDPGVALGGLRTPADFAKALALGADGIAVANAAIQAIGCLGMRACNTDNCPVGIATQKPGLRQRLVVDDAARRLTRFLEATVELMQVMARACGHSHLNAFGLDDLATWYKRWYAPNNATLVVVGDVQPDNVRMLAERYFGPLPTSDIEPLKPAATMASSITCSWKMGTPSVRSSTRRTPSLG